MSEQTAGREPKFWDCSAHREQLTHTTIDEAVESWAAGQPRAATLPEFVTVYGFAPMELPSASRLSADALDHIIEQLDEEHGDPDDSTEPTTAMREAALQFAETIRGEYVPWMCEQVAAKAVRVADHVPAGWLPEASQ